MDTQSVWNLLAAIPAGKIVAWGIVICAIITAIVTGVVKLYKLFTKYKEMQDKEKKQNEKIEEFDKTLKSVNDSLREINDSLKIQKDVDLKLIRHFIVEKCISALERGEISASSLASLEEMFEEYERVFHGNGYVKTLMIKVRKLPVIVMPED